MLPSGRRQQSPFQSLYERVRVVHGFTKNHGHPCRLLTNRYVLGCVERRIVLAGKKSAFDPGVVTCPKLVAALQVAPLRRTKMDFGDHQRFAITTTLDLSEDSDWRGREGSLNLIALMTRPGAPSLLMKQCLSKYVPLNVGHEPMPKKMWVKQIHAI